ncbi:MAG: hypothetical protein L0Z62_33370 [Gemmataceae bacterium]|nr:hypothetical protein [Gemmataceae bacterium]
MARFDIIWDLEDDPEGNIAHIAEHDISPEEVEEVLNDLQTTFSTSASSGRPMAFGWTSLGRYLTVVYEEAKGDPSTVKPVSAYEVPPPSGRAKKKGKRRG